MTDQKTTTARNVNYTEEMENEIVETMRDIKSHEDQVAAVVALASKFSKSVRSVTAKMSNLARTNSDLTFYKKEKTTKNGGKVESKSDKVEKIAGLLGAPAENIESLEKANKTVLDLLVSKLEMLEATTEKLAELEALTEQAE